MTYGTISNGLTYKYLEGHKKNRKKFEEIMAIFFKLDENDNLTGQTISSITNIKKKNHRKSHYNEIAENKKNKIILLVIKRKF